MGSKIVIDGLEREINDTLNLTCEHGFPSDLKFRDNLRDHAKVLRNFIGKEYGFFRPGLRLFHDRDTRSWLVHNINGKWLYWGHARVLEQRLVNGNTEGVYSIAKIYDPISQLITTLNEAPEGKSYFNESTRQHIQGLSAAWLRGSSFRGTLGKYL
jgi:hypothetical protein